MEGKACNHISRFILILDGSKGTAWACLRDLPVDNVKRGTQIPEPNKRARADDSCAVLWRLSCQEGQLPSKTRRTKIEPRFLLSTN